MLPGQTVSRSTELDSRSMHRAVAPGTAQREAECEGYAIRHVLAPLDGSPLGECALPWAVAVAEAASARMTLLRVLEVPEARDANGRHRDAVEWELKRAEARSQLAGLDGHVRARGLTSAVEILEGRPAEQIINFAAAHQVDLIVLSSHGEGGLSRWTLSSTALMVVTRAHSSVLVVPAHAAEGLRIGDVRLARIMVPLDCSPRAECILPLAVALARAHAAELILAHVIPEPEMPRRMAPSPEDLALAAEFTERNRLAGEEYLCTLRERLAGQGLRVGMRTTVSSRRTAAIRDLADQAAADLIMVCAHGRSGEVSERYGSVAGRLLADSNRPILVFQDLAGVRGTTPAEEAARSHPGH